MYNAIIHMKKTRGSIDRVITLLVTGCKLSKELINEYYSQHKGRLDLNPGQT